MSDIDPRGVDWLLRELLWEASNESGADQPVLSDARLMAAIRGEQPLSSDEYNQIVNSAATQEHYALLLQQEQARVYQALIDKGLEPAPIVLLAAADEAREVRPLRIEMNGYAIELTPIDAAGSVWHIRLEVSRELAEICTTGLTLGDDQGLIWLSGRPDEQGRLEGYWEREDDLLERLSGVKLTLKPA